MALVTTPSEEIGTGGAVQSGDRPRYRVLTAPALIALVLVGAALRFYRLDARSMWLDEVAQAHVVRFSSLGEAFDFTHVYSDVVPLLNILTWLLRGLGGDDWAVRLPSALAGTLNIAGIYLLGKGLVNRRVGLMSALLLALLPFAVYYSQEARPYAILMLLTTLQLWLAHRCIRLGGYVEWLAFFVVTILNLYTHYTALLVTAGVYVFLLVSLVLKVRAVRRKAVARGEPSRPHIVRLLAPALGATLLAAAAYAPWLPFLAAFLQRKTLGFGEVDARHAATLGEFADKLGEYGFSGALAAFLLAGLVALALLLPRNRQASLLLGAGLLVPVGVLIFKYGGGIVQLQSRYLSFLLPTLVVTAAVGVETLAEAIRRLAVWLLPAVGATAQDKLYAARAKRAALGAAYFVAIALALTGLLPALAGQYDIPKDDYRGAADYIIANSPSGSSVLVMGKYKAFVRSGLEHYFWLRRSPINIIDGVALDEADAEALAQSKGTVWAAVFTNYPPPTDLDGVPREGLEFASFQGQVVIRTPSPGGDASQQAATLLRWGSAFQPGLLSSATLVDVAAGRAQLGPNLLPPLSATSEAAPKPPLERWTLRPGVAPAEGGDVVQLAPTGAELNAVLVTNRLVPGRRYLLRFEFRNSALQGEQRVFATTASEADAPTGAFPTGNGFLCRPTASWAVGSFAFTVPAETERTTVWLRATGTGQAEFRRVELFEVKSAK